MKYISNSGHMKDSASSINYEDYISGATDLDVNIYMVDTRRGREESDPKLPDPRCNLLQNRTHYHEFC